MAEQKPHHSLEQTRDPDSKAFRGSYARQRLHFVLRTVALALHPEDPLALTQLDFDRHAAGVMEKLGEPAPASARSIYMRLNRGRTARASWRELIEESLREDASFTQTIAKRNATAPDWSLDERHIWYSLRRACQHLEKPNGPLTQDEYERAYDELLAADTRRPGSVLADCLATKSQILGLCEHDWALACRLAGIAEPVQEAHFHGHDPLKLLTHLYYTKRVLPAHRDQLVRHAREVGVIGPDTRVFKLRPLKQQFIDERAARGLETPKDGPAPGDTLSPTELDALLAGGDTKKPRGHWTDNPELVLDALAAYIEQYEHTTKRLGQKHYLGVYQEHDDWPPPVTVGRLAKKLLPDTPRAGFNAMLEFARRRNREAKAA